MSRIILAGFVAGLRMAIAMAIGEKVGLMKINLPRIDGQFFFKDRFTGNVVYFLGLVIHAATSIGFALGYLIFSKMFPLSIGWIASGLLWAAILWVAFGVTVSPLTGYGLFGSKAGKWTWLLAGVAVYSLRLWTDFYVAPMNHDWDYPFNGI